AADLPAAGVCAPHIRQRVWFDAQRVDHATGTRWEPEGEGAEGETWDEARVRRSEPGRADGGVADSEWFGRRGRNDGRSNGDAGGLHAETEAARSGTAGGVAYAEGQRRNGRQNPAGTSGRCCTQNGSGVADPSSRRVGIGQKAGREAEPSRVGTDGFWDDAVWIPCADGKARRLKPGLEPLVEGLPGRVALLRGAGNAIVPQVAAVFVKAYMEAVSLVPPQRAGSAS